MTRLSKVEDTDLCVALVDLIGSVADTSAKPRRRRALRLIERYARGPPLRALHTVAPGFTRGAGFARIAADEPAPWRGRARGPQREARAALRAWFPQERDGRVLSAIGRYLRADELGTP